ncbi:DUF3568 family protein [Francisella sp. TX07-6608]|uniref:DUF3568 family protein n=1 Tax=Francisella sp. TX07-6608 TaxID=573568 RepID=UPI0008F99CC7|nr:DUF3568 family protein [Francisella sp. TX07-6608]OIN82953.1 putative lipoprotein [Francisella sp. TX07-6608]OIN85094.1 putative lipoprotein [Francisella sp. TX07-6608]
MNKLKLVLCAAGLSVLVGCSNTQMAVTGLSLAGAAIGYIAYGWMKNPDASNAYEKTPNEVIQATNDTLKENKYTIVKTETSNKDNTYLIEAENARGQKVDIAISPVEDNSNQAKIYIKGTSFDGVSKAQSQILLNQINKKLV